MSDDIQFSADQIAVYRRAVDCAHSWIDDERKRAIEWGQHPDWPWNGFILSHATHGGSRNWREIEPLYDKEYAWQSLKEVSQEERLRRFTKLNGRFKNKIGSYAEENFNILHCMGGPSKGRKIYRGLKSAIDRINWIKKFSGFSDKYARNIAMDIYDELLRDTFAIDSRLRTQLEEMGHVKSKYSHNEALFRAIAEELKVEPWTLDRVAYRCHQCIMSSLVNLNAKHNAQAASS